MKTADKLRHELELAGATPSEMSGLLAIADQLGRLEKPLSNVRATGWRKSTVRLLAASIATLAVGVLTISYAQTSLPGSWSYPVKRVSEQASVIVDPSYKATLMMRRSQEVKSLVENHASTAIVLATLHAYEVEAASYKVENYAAFTYCKTNLTQAAIIAPNPQRKAINNTLQAIQT